MSNYPRFFWTQLVVDTDSNAGKWHYVKMVDADHVETICGTFISTKLTNRDAYSTIVGTKQASKIPDKIACPDCLPKYNKLVEEYAAKTRQTKLR